MREANDALSAVCVDTASTFVDQHALLSDTTGLPRRGTSRDGVHLTDAAYVEVAQELERVLSARLP